MMTNDAIALAADGSGLRPDLCLAVGVTGHRLARLQNVDLQTLRATIAAEISNDAQADRLVKYKFASNGTLRMPCVNRNAANSRATPDAATTIKPVRRGKNVLVSKLHMMRNQTPDPGTPASKKLDLFVDNAAPEDAPHAGKDSE